MRAHASVRLSNVRGTTPELLGSHRGSVCPLSVAPRVTFGALVWLGKRDSPTRHPLLPLNAGTAEPFRVSPPEAVAYQLELRTEAGLYDEMALSVRIGMNTGLVVVGRIGDNLRMDYTAIGDTTNLAARMQQMAPTGAIWVTEATYRVAGEAFVWQALGPMAVKGKADDLPVYALLGQHQVRSRFEVVAQRGLTQFIGRYPELQRLLAALMQAERVGAQA